MREAVVCGARRGHGFRFASRHTVHLLALRIPYRMWMGKTMLMPGD